MEGKKIDEVRALILIFAEIALLGIAVSIIYKFFFE